MKKLLILFPLIMFCCSSPVEKQTLCLKYYSSKNICIGSPMAEIKSDLSSNKILFDLFPSDIDNKELLRYMDSFHSDKDSIGIENLFTFENQLLTKITTTFNETDSIKLSRVQEYIIENCQLKHESTTLYGRTFTNNLSKPRVSLYPLKKVKDKNSIELVISTN